MSDQFEGGENVGGDAEVDAGSPDRPGDDGVLQPEDSLVTDNLEADPLDTGIIPPDRWSAAQGYGNTPSEEEAGEGLDRRLAEELPDVDAHDPLAPGSGPTPGDETEPGAEADSPDPRAGRLVAADEGAHPDEESDAVARDVGVNGGAATAEEAAMHVVDEESADQ